MHKIFVFVIPHSAVRVESLQAITIILILQKRALHTIFTDKKNKNLFSLIDTSKGNLIKNIKLLLRKL